jgi:hypothetical protein
MFAKVNDSNAFAVFSNSASFGATLGRCGVVKKSHFGCYGAPFSKNFYLFDVFTLALSKILAYDARRWRTFGMTHSDKHNSLRRLAEIALPRDCGQMGFGPTQ